MAAPAVKVTVAVFGRVRELTEAKKLTVAETVDLTVNVATPDGEEVADAGLIVTPVGRFADSATDLPEIGFEAESRSVAVIVEVVLPFAATDVGEAVRVDVAGLTDPAAIAISWLEQMEVNPAAEA